MAGRWIELRFTPTTAARASQKNRNRPSIAQSESRRASPAA
jgi:hypothetical protein